MTYEQVDNTILKFSESNFKRFAKKADECLKSFTDNNKIISLIDNNKLTLQHFHNLLHTLFPEQALIIPYLTRYIKWLSP